MQNRFRVGDKVKVNDGSWSVRVDSYHAYSDLHGICNDTFEILSIQDKNHTDSIGDKVHDVFIKNLSDGKVYLHSQTMLSPVKVKEVTMADIERQYGCKVKIVK